jgi:hypothetical protein
MPLSDALCFNVLFNWLCRLNEKCNAISNALRLSRLQIFIFVSSSNQLQEGFEYSMVQVFEPFPWISKMPQLSRGGSIYFC